MREASVQPTDNPVTNLHRLFTPTTAWLCSLDSFPLLSLQGPDSKQFLQAQTTNDLNALDQQSIQLSGYCNPKGRLIAVFHIFRVDDQCYYLQIHQAMIAAVSKRLTIYKLRSQFDLEVKSSWHGLGLIGNHAADIIADSCSVSPPPQGGLLRRDDCIIVNESGFCNRYAIYAAEDFIAALRRQWLAHSEEKPSTVWRLHTIVNGLPTIYPETSEKLVPQMVNLDLVKGLSFDKGCYPGQEVVARTYYRGKLKQRMHLFDCGHNEAAPGDSVFISQFSDHQAAGIVVDAVACNEGPRLALVSARLKANEPVPQVCLHHAAGAAIQCLPWPDAFSG